MHIEVFHYLLNRICAQLTEEAQSSGFKKALVFENRVREVTKLQADLLDSDTDAQTRDLAGFADDFPLSLEVDMTPPAQAFI